MNTIPDGTESSLFLQRRFRNASRWCGALVAAAGAVALAGWALGNETLKGLWAAPITVKTNTAVLLLATGLALFLLAPGRRAPLATVLGRLLGLLALGTGLATLSQHVVGWDLGIDQILFTEPPGVLATSYPNRMGPPASLCLPLFGLALLMLDYRTRHGRAPFQWVALGGLVVVSVPALGYVFRVQSLYGMARFTGIALHTTIALLLLGLGILLARPEAGFTRLLASPDSGGVLLRRLLPASIVLPVLLGWLRVQGEELGFYDRDFGRSLLILSFVVAFSAVTWWVAAAVSRHATARVRAEEAERELLVRLAQSLESEREARNAAERSNRMKDEFVATLSHELRTPLNAIVGWAGLLGKEGLASTDAERGVEAIQRNALLQAQLIDDLLDMSRIVSGKIRLEPRSVELPGLVDSVLEAAVPSATAKGLSLGRSIEPIGAVWADPHRIEQVLWNLVSNAIKFTPEGGRVDVSLRGIDGAVELAVADTGAGIEPEFLPHVFDRFTQADGSTTRRQGGLGLGLPIARQLVELHGGTIEAFSEGPERGSRFVVRLPRRVAAGPHPTGPETVDDGPAEEIDLGGARILVVDDQADMRELVERILRMRNARVTLAADVSGALARLAGAPFDVLVSDIGMPGRDGYELIRAVRARWPTLPAIALTAFVRPEDRDRAIAEGYQVHLPKPVRPAPLLRAIAELMRRPHPVS